MNPVLLLCLKYYKCSFSKTLNDLKLVILLLPTSVSAKRVIFALSILLLYSCYFFYYLLVRDIIVAILKAHNMLVSFGVDFIL